METSNSVTQPQKNKFKKVLKYLLFGTSSLIAILFLLNWIWMMSGSNQWKLEREKDGVKVYTLKSPGSRFIKVKAIGRIRSTLAGIVRLAIEPSCEDVGCYDQRLIARIDSLPGYYYYTFRFDLPFPFATREFVILTTFSQNPQSKEIFIDIIATPNKIPPDECCVRVAQMHNTWRFTPLENGEVDVEFVADTDPGGGVPYFLTNLGAPSGSYDILIRLQEILNKEKYQNAKIDYVQELEIHN